MWARPSRKATLFAVVFCLETVTSRGEYIPTPGLITLQVHHWWLLTQLPVGSTSTLRQSRWDYFYLHFYTHTHPPFKLLQIPTELSIPSTFHSLDTTQKTSLFSCVTFGRREMSCKQWRKSSSFQGFSKRSIQKSPPVMSAGTSLKCPLAKTTNGKRLPPTSSGRHFLKVGNPCLCASYEQFTTVTDIIHSCWSLQFQAWQKIFLIQVLSLSKMPLSCWTLAIPWQRITSAQLAASLEAAQPQGIVFGQRN